MSDHVGDDPTPHAGSGAPRRSATQLASDPAFTGTYASRSAAGFEDLATQSAAAFRPWHAALANRDNARAVAVCVGDSLTEGIGAGTLSNRWLAHVQRNLRARFPLASPVTGGDGYFASWLGNTVPTGPWTSTGSPTVRADFGLGRRQLRFTAAGTATVTFTGTDAILYYGKGGNAAGSFTWAVDGGSTTTVSWTGTILDGNAVNITGLTAGSHTLVCTWVSGEVHVDGLWAFNGDYSKGIHVLDAGHAGFAVADFSVNTFWTKALAAVAPSLITIELGVNDQRIAGVSSAQFKTNLTAFIAQIRSNYTSPCTIALVAAYQPTGTFTEPWANYVQAMRDIVATDSTLVFLDLGLRMEPAVVANTNSLYSADLIHPSASGHGFIGQVVTRFIEPR